MLETYKLPVIRVVMAGILVALFATLFWTQSRYPALNDKAIMEGSIQLEDPLSFESLLSVDPSFPMWKKIIYTTINWVKTNKNGMTFGILMGAAFLTLIRHLPRKSLKGRFANSAAGMAIGAPMGVCVNCAAPIGKGIYTAGARAELTLSAMIASPTLNIVVLTMAFGIMPIEIAVTKLVLSIFVILVVVPVIVRMSPGTELMTPQVNESCEIDVPAAFAKESMFSAAKGFTSDYLRDLWFIVSRTVPLMLVAGFLGAIVGNLIPLETFAGAEASIILFLVVAVIGIFLPVPIGFDVIVAGTLLSAGLSSGLVMVLVFTLGIFSIYSFIIVGSTISWRVARNLSVAIVLIAVLAGFSVEAFHQYQMRQSLELLMNL